MDDQQRTKPPRTADDRASLLAFLEYQRETLEMKCAGLSAEQLRKRAVPPSDLSLLGLVRHMASVERSWFQWVWCGADIERLWPQAADGSYGEWEVTDASDPDEAFGLWEAACGRSRGIVAEAASLDDTVEFRGEVFSLRYIVTHMIEEYARHNGHADLLREAIDGRTGE
ncbi:DinB family protein [Streptomyces sp. NPDC002851]